MPALFTRVETRVRSTWIGPLGGALLLGLCVLACGDASAAAFGSAGQQTQPRHTQKRPAAGTETAKKPNVVVFALSGKPAPGKPWERRLKGLPKMRPLSAEEKLKIVQGVQGLPAVSAAAATPFLTLTPGHLYEPTGNLELGWPAWDRLGIAYYNPALGTEDGGAYDGLAKDGHVLLTFKADAGNVYLVDFIVVIELPPDSTTWRDFELTASGLPPSDQKAYTGGNHLAAVFYAQNSGWYTARLGLKPKQGDVYPRWGDWYFLAVEVTKFVPAS